MFSAYAAQVAAPLLTIVPPVAAGPLLGLGLLLCTWHWISRGDEERTQAVQDALVRSRTALGGL